MGDEYQEIQEVFVVFNQIKALNELRQQRKKKRSCAVRQINRTRDRLGYFKVTFCEIKMNDKAQFFEMTRMTPAVFEMLLSLIKSYMIENNRNLLSTEFRLALTLLYLSQASSFQSLAWSWKVGKETVRLMVYETCEALWAVLGPLYVSEPNLNDYILIEKDFNNHWNFPNCVGAVDGKHIAIQCPSDSISQYFNYKKFYSIVLMAACDANYIFTHIDVGAYGSQSDGGIFNQSSFGKRLCGGNLGLPEPVVLPGTQTLVPHFFVGDAAFTLTQNLMKPYPGVGLSKPKEIFNRRVSRARRVIENAFGILVCRWRILLTTLNMQPDNAEKIVLSCVALHNFLRLNAEIKTLYAPSKYMDWEDSSHQQQPGLWRQEVGKNLASIKASRSLHVLGGSSAIKMRDTLCNFVNNEGSLDWLQ